MNIGKIIALVIMASAGTRASLAAPITDTDATQKTSERRNLPVEGVITTPDWARKPTGDDVARFYPQFPQFLNLEGNALIHCVVTTQGELANCAVTSESPKGLRFGEAALKLAPSFRMRPMTVDGSAVGGGEINIPIRFRLPSDRMLAASPSAAPASPKAMALARRISVIAGAQFAATWAAAADKWKAHLPDMSPEEAAALDAYRQSLAEVLPQATDRYATIYARTYSEQELADVAAFYESVSGRAWLTRQPATAAAMQAASVEIQSAISAGALARFCKTTDCPTAVNPAPSAARK